MPPFPFVWYVIQGLRHAILVDPSETDAQFQKAWRAFPRNSRGHASVDDVMDLGEYEEAIAEDETTCCIFLIPWFRSVSASSNGVIFPRP